MSFALVQIADVNLEEPFMVLGASEAHVCGLAVAYLRAVQPYKADGSRLVVPDTKPEDGWPAWLDQELMDVEDVTVTTWNTDRGDLLLAGDFLAEISDNGHQWLALHTPYVVDVVTDL